MKLRKLADELYDTVKTDGLPVLEKFVIEHGGFIDLQDDDCDSIWGYRYDDEYVSEYQVKAIRYTEGHLEVYLDHWNIDITKEELEDDSTEWELLSPFSEILLVPTLLNILECIEEYVDD